MFGSCPFCQKEFEGSLGWIVHRFVEDTCPSLIDRVDNLSEQDKTAFEKWIDENNWFEAADGEWDQSDDLNCFTRYNIYQLYWEYTESILEPSKK